MPKPNYSFEKRQREIAKKKKQDAKDAKRREARISTPGDAEAVAESVQETAAPVSPAPEPATTAPRVHLRRATGE